MKRTLSKVMAIALTLAMVLSGLFVNPVTAFAAKTKEVKVTQVKADFSKTALCIGDTKDIKATIKPSDATNKKLTYTSSDAKVAKVSKEGQITAISDGKATITVKAADSSKKSTTITVTVYKDATITNKDVKDGVATLKAGTYGNVTISKTVDKAKVVINKAIIKGSLLLENGAAYTVETTKSSINEVAVVSGSAISAQAVTIPVRPTFIASVGARITNFFVGEAAIITATSGRIGTINVSPANGQNNLFLELNGFNGSLQVNPANNSNVTINTVGSRIQGATITGGATNQTLTLSSAGTDLTSYINNLSLLGRINLTVNVPTTTVSVGLNASSAILAIDRPVTTLLNAGASTAITVNSTITSVTTTGEGATLSVAENAVVGSITAGGSSTQITGEGTVTDVRVEGNDVNVATKGTTVAVATGVTGTTADGRSVGGGTTTGSAPTTTPPSTGTGGGSGGGSPAPSTSKVTKSFSLESPASAVVIKFSNGASITVGESEWASLLLSQSVDTQKTIEGITAKLVSIKSSNTFEVSVTSSSASNKQVYGTYTFKITKTAKGYDFVVTYMDIFTGIDSIQKQ